MGEYKMTGMRTCRMRGISHHAAAFTLLEILLATCVIAILSSLTVVAVSKMKTHGETVRGAAAAKTLINAFLLHATENNQALFPGVDQTAGLPGNELWYNNREVANDRPSHIYPFRLAPYLNDEFHGSIFAGENYQDLESQGGLTDYNIATYPAFGMNFNFVGGHIGNGGQYTASTAKNAILSNNDAEGQIIVFASSGIRYGNSQINGYHEVKPPNHYGSLWNSSGWKNGSNPNNYGHVNARFNNKAIVAMLDGSIRMLTIDELRDMRLWSRDAYRQNDKYFRPPSPEIVIER